MPRWTRVQRGQTIIIVALCIVVLMGMVAAAIDGGSALLQRRNMQNGADAAVLGAIEMMEGNIAVTCSPAPCHPTYADLTNQGVQTRVTELITANQGGVVGDVSATTYPAPFIEYHFMAGAPDCAPSASACYQPATNYDLSYPPPAYADGVRVTNAINNPTTFARVINITSVPVSAIAAARVYPVCSSTSGSGRTLPMLRFGPAIRDFLQQNGNSRCSPAVLWTSHPDVGGFDNFYSLGQQSFYGTGPVQLISGFDGRNGPPPPAPPDGGLTTWQNLNQANKQCTPATSQYCANMLGYGQDSPGTNWTAISDWIFWQWRGTISLTQTYSVPLGRSGGNATRSGDWAEVYNQGNGGNNVGQPLHDLAAQYGAALSESPPANQGGLNWGNVVTRTLYLWGPDSTPGQAIDDTTTAQTYCDPCDPNGYNYFGWEDLHLTGSNGSYAVSNSHGGNYNQIDRVRFTDSYQIRIYANLQGNYQPVAPPECQTWTWSPPNSVAYGLIIDTVQPPSGGTCGWSIGGGVYGRIVDPGSQ